MSQSVVHDQIRPGDHRGERDRRQVAPTTPTHHRRAIIHPDRPRIRDARPRVSGSGLPRGSTRARAAWPPRRRAATAGSPPAVRSASTIPREAAISPPAGPGANAADSCSTCPPCAPTPGSRNTARRHQLAQRARIRSGAVAPTTAPTSLRPAVADPARAELRHDPGEAVADGPAAGQLEVLEVGGPRIRGRTSTNRPPPRRARRVDERLERVGPEQRVDRQGVRAEPVDGAVRRSAVSPRNACA